jgi:hypothetical protein
MIPPQDVNITWHNFTTNLHLIYILTNTIYSRQRRESCTHTSLLDEFYLKTINIHNYQSTANTTLTLNFDHFPIYLHISNNILIARPLLPPKFQLSYILNPILTQNIK